GSASRGCHFGLNSSSMTLCQITPPPLMLSTLAVSSLLLLPVHTPTVTYGVKPTAHASFQSLVVPVLTAAGRESFSLLLSPQIGLRAWSSLRILLMIAT